MKDNYSFLIQKLDAFIRKYYVNQLLRGVLYTSIIILIFFLVIVVAENQFYFTTAIRKFLFFSFVLVSLGSLGLFVLRPFLQINRLGKIISHEQAADIIGKHFSNVEDKLLNILQLKQQQVSLADASLIEASIQQKSEQLQPVPFTKAVDYNENRKYIKYLIPPFLIFLLLLFFKPSIIKDSTQRLVNNNIEYEKPMPFQIEITNNNLEVLQFDDLALQIKVSGNTLPEDIYIVNKNIKNVAQKLNDNNFSYVFSNLQDDLTFYIEAAGFNTEAYSIKVNPKPMITNFQLKLDYPQYVGLKDQTISNNGDISVPEGTKITWIFDANATNKISMQFSDTLFLQENIGNNQFIFDKVLLNSDKYIVKLFNNKVSNIDSTSFNLAVEKDVYPEISVESFVDSTNLDVYYYIGTIKDDYGLSALKLHYSIQTEEETKRSVKSIPFKSGLISDFDFYWNIKEIGLNPGDQLSYYFEVFDNDQINGSKSTKSKWMTFKLPSIDELEQESDQQIDEIKKELASSIQESKEIQEKLKELQEDLLQKKDMSWETQKEIEKLLEKQKSLNKQVAKMEESFKSNIQKQNEFKELNPELKKKQEQVQRLFESVLDDEMKAMIDKLEKLMEELDKEKAMDQLAEMEVNDEDLEQELDRMLALLEKLENEKKVQDAIDKLKELQDKQEQLAEESRKKNSEQEELLKEQEKIAQEMENIKEELEEIAEKSDDFDLDESLEKSDEAQDEMDSAKDNLNKNNKQQAAENQKNASKKMQEMAQSLQEMMNAMQQQQAGEDMETIRQLLENLVVLSLEQERIFEDFKTTTINTPAYINLVQEQFKIIDDSKLVEDSLFALAKRVFEIESFITDEIQAINRNLDKAVDLLEERQTKNAVVNQQYVMTGYNNLALMLSEVMSQMQQQMAQQMQGNQMCENPGNKPGAKPGKIPSLKQMQQQLSDQISEMSEMMKSGQSSKPGQSQKLAEMAAKQQAIRQAMQELDQQDNKDGNGSLGNLQEIIDDMEKNETDLVNKQITNELLERQQDIMTRLLEAENAEKERDEKEERESITAKQLVNEVPPSLEEYRNKQKSSIDIYKSIPPKLVPFYKNISQKYADYLYNNK